MWPRSDTFLSSVKTAEVLEQTRRVCWATETWGPDWFLGSCWIFGVLIFQDPPLFWGPLWEIIFEDHLRHLKRTGLPSEYPWTSAESDYNYSGWRGAVESCETWPFGLRTFGLLFMSDDNGLKVDRDYLGDTLGRFNVDFIFEIGLWLLRSFVDLINWRLIRPCLIVVHFDVYKSTWHIDQVTHVSETCSVLVCAQ